MIGANVELTQNKDLILRIIREDKDFRKDLMAVATTIEDKIYSYYGNSGCSCKSNILAWIDSNIAETNRLLAAHDKTVQSTLADMAKVAEFAKTTQATQAALKPPSSISGTVFNIPREDDKYKALIKSWSAERKVYRGIAVAEAVEDGVKIWKIFVH